ATTEIYTLSLHDALPIFAATISSGAMRAAAYFAVISALALWAGNWIVARSVRDDIAPALITSARAVLVMLCLAPLALPGLRARLRAFNARDWAVLGGLGVF